MWVLHKSSLTNYIQERSEVSLVNEISLGGERFWNLDSLSTFSNHFGLSIHEDFQSHF